MMKLFTSMLLMAVTSAVGQTPIPKDSKAAWDYRGTSSLTIKAIEDLYKCSTYEELREKLVLATYVGDNADCTAPIYTASDCTLALIRTCYILGDKEIGDKMLSSYSAVNQGINRPDPVSIYLKWKKNKK